MKRIVAMIVCALMLFSLVGCQNDGGSSKNKKYDKIINKAIDLVMEAWTEEYEKNNFDGDGTVQITNTRLVVIQESDGKHAEYFKDIAYIVEFVIFSDYYGTAPYYVDVGINNCVIVYKDGTMKATTNWIKAVFGVTFSYPTDHMDKVIDCGSEYNTTKKCK